MTWTTGTDLDSASVLDFVRREIDEYDYVAVALLALNGIPSSPAMVDAALGRFRAALVKPYWIEAELRDTFEDVTNSHAVLVRCLVITDDRDGYLLAYDPARRDFMLVDARHGQYATLGVRGDPVGCYLSM